jgi:hypothetical protein
MSRGAYAYRDLDEEIFAPPECTHHMQLGTGGDDTCGGYYQSHSSPVPLVKAAAGLSESTILRRHLAMRRARRTKTVLVGGIVVLLLSTVMLCVLSRLPSTDKSALELVISAPYGALRRANTAASVKTSASTPVSQEEAAEAAAEMADKRSAGLAGVGVGDDDPYDPHDPLDPQFEHMEVPEADEQEQKKVEKAEAEKEKEDDPYDPDGEEEEESEGVDNEW